MKNAKEISPEKAPDVTIDPALNAYRDKIMFPEKLHKANEMLKTANLPPKQPVSKL